MIRTFAGPARVINLILAIWLFISAFAWQHTTAQRTNTWILGVLAFVFALAAMREPRARFLNTVLGVWLFISAFALASMSTATVWNNWILGVVIFAVSLIPPAAETTMPVQQLPKTAVPPVEPRTPPPAHSNGSAPYADRRVPPPQEPRHA